MATNRLTWHVNRSIKRVLVEGGKRIPLLMSLMRLMLFTRSALYYRLSCLRSPINPRAMIFECFGGRGYSCSPRALFRTLLAEGDNADREMVWAFRGPIVAALAERGGYTIRGMHGFYPGTTFDGTLDSVFGEEALEELRRAVIIPYGSREYYRTYARSSMWISNSIIPTHLKPRGQQTYIQTWHGTPLKRLGCDIADGTSNALFSVRDIHKRYRREGARMTQLVSPSAFATEKFTTAFDLKRRAKTHAIIEEGYPRNDVLSTFSPQQAAAIRRRLGIPAGKRVLLYAPTWRDNQHVAGIGYTYDLAADFECMRRDLGDDYVILFRAHYLVANEFDFSRNEGFVLDVSNVNDINDLYIVSDLLVTDYSSVFFDYSILDRPILFYMYDLDAYANDIRGFYLGLDELPGPIVRTEAELVTEILQSESAEHDAGARRAEFRNRFTYLDDGHASERTLARILGA